MAWQDRFSDVGGVSGCLWHRTEEGSAGHSQRHSMPKYKAQG